MHDEERGFTILELLVVVLVIGTLAAIAVPRFTLARTRAQDAAAQANLQLAAFAARSIILAGVTGVTGATTSELTGEEPRLAYVTGVASTGPGTVSSAVVGSRWSGGVGSASGTCHWSLIDSTGGERTGTMPGTCLVRNSTLAGTMPVTSGLTFWLDASNTAGLWQDSIGTIAAADGQRVCRAGLGSATGVLVQTTLSRCPYLRTDARGPAIDFDANGWLEGSVGTSSASSVFVVAQSDTRTWNTSSWIAGSRELAGFLITGAQGTTEWRGYAYGANSGGTLGYDAGALITLSDITVPRAYWLVITMPGAVNTAMGVDGTTETRSTTWIVSRAATTMTMRIGADYGVTNRNGDGRYREVLVYNRALSTQERTDVLTYLRNKWGLE